MTTRPTGLLGRRSAVLAWTALVAWTSVLAVLVAPGCSMPRRTPNPSFSIVKEDAQADLARMAAAPVQLERPLIVLAGIGDPAISSSAIIRGVAPCVTGTVVELEFFNEFTFDGARQKLLREVAAALAVEQDHIPEVDVIAFSMGGLIARDAAIPDKAGRRLPVRRMFSISVPHEGARLGGVPLGLPQGDDMSPTSDFIDRLRRTRRAYDLVCYARLDDATVGEEFAAPDGEPLWWVPTPSGEWAHMAAFSDPRILADIARRLRGETPHSRPPAAPLPQ